MVSLSHIVALLVWNYLFTKECVRVEVFLTSNNISSASMAFGAGSENVQKKTNNKWQELAAVFRNYS
jgi:hypothetical protein